MLADVVDQLLTQQTRHTIKEEPILSNGMAMQRPASYQMTQQPYQKNFQHAQQVCSGCTQLPA